MKALHELPLLYHIQGGYFMELNQYQSLLEQKFGHVELPKTKKDVDNIIKALEEQMESPTWQDFYLLQAILIIKTWSGCNDESDNFIKIER